MSRRLRFPPTSRRSILPLIGVSAAIALDLGASLFGDTPDTRATTEAIGRYFTQHRTAIMIGTILLTASFVALTGIALALAERIEANGRRFMAQLVRASAVVTLAVYLVTIPLLYTGLSYVIGAESPASAKAIFELTLVASLVTSWPLAAMIITTGLGLHSSGLTRPWFSILTAILGGVLAVGTTSFAHHGYFSPDVQQQVFFVATTVWLMTVGFSLRRPDSG